MADLEAEARAFLGGAGCTTEHIAEQIEKMRDLRNYLPSAR